MNLKSLSVEFSPDEGAFSQMPALPNLEAVHVVFSAVNVDDLRRLAELPRLKALDLKYADFVADAKLEDLAGSNSLEELTIDGDFVSAAGLESLAAIEPLRAIHITSRSDLSSNERDARVLELDGGDRLLIYEREVDGFRRALHRLRQCRPEIVIDGDEYALNRNFQRGPPWDAIRYGGSPRPPYLIESSVLRSTWLPNLLPRAVVPGIKASCPS